MVHDIYALGGCSHGRKFLITEYLAVKIQDIPYLQYSWQLISLVQTSSIRYPLIICTKHELKSSISYTIWN